MNVEKITVPGLAGRKAHGGMVEDKIVMVTAYDATFAALADEAGVDVVLVGDSMGMVVQGVPNTLPVTLDEANIRAILARPGVLADISSAYDSPASTVDGWVDVIARQTWASGEAVHAVTGPGPLVTDDRPRPEYFLLRRLFDRGSR